MSGAGGVRSGMKVSLSKWLAHQDAGSGVESGVEAVPTLVRDVPPAPRVGSPVPRTQNFGAQLTSRADWTPDPLNKCTKMKNACRASQLWAVAAPTSDAPPSAVLAERRLARLTDSDRCGFGLRPASLGSRGHPK